MQRYPQKWRHSLVSVLLFIAPSPSASATVYEWKSPNGVRHFSNHAEIIPESHKDTARTFTSRLAGKTQAASADSPDIGVPSDADEVTQARAIETHIAAYERGLERGLQTAKQQVQMAGELARTMLAAMPRPAPRTPTRVIIQHSEPIVRHIHSPAYVPFGSIGPYAPYNYGRFSYRGRFVHRGYGYSFHHRNYGRFIKHSHFSPFRRRHHTDTFFPRGHFSNNGFLFGHGFLLR